MRIWIRLSLKCGSRSRFFFINAWTDEGIQKFPNSQAEPDEKQDPNPDPHRKHAILLLLHWPTLHTLHGLGWRAYNAAPSESPRLHLWASMAPDPAFQYDADPDPVSQYDKMFGIIAILLHVNFFLFLIFLADFEYSTVMSNIKSHMTVPSSADCWAALRT